MKHAMDCRCPPCRNRVLQCIIDDPDVKDEAKMAIGFTMMGIDAEEAKGIRRNPVLIEDPQMFMVMSERDGYLTGIVLASDEDEARQMGWDALLESRPDHWQDYHKDKSELKVMSLGDSFWAFDETGKITEWPV